MATTAKKHRVRMLYDDNYNPSDYGISGFEPTLAKQADAASCDINNIVSRWMKTGALPTHLNEGIAQFVDVSDIPDYRGCLDVVLQAQKLFGELPSQIRQKFDNEPAAFLDFCNDPRNIDEMISMGLATKRAEPSTGSDNAPPKAGVAEPVGGSAEAPAAS